MTSWKPALLSSADRILIRDGLLVEYAPGMTMPADEARHMHLRAAAIAAIAPAGYSAVTRTALWILCGHQLYGQPPALTLSHPRTSTEANASRRTIPPEHTMTISALRVTTPAVTCFDFLVLESATIAVEAIGALLRSGWVGTEQIDEQFEIQYGRRHRAHAWRIWREARTTISALAAPLPSSIP